LNKIEASFDTCRAVGIAALMSGEAKAEAFPKSLHLGNGNHRRSRSAQHDDVRVVDQDALGRSAKVAQRLGQEDFAVETLERRVTLKEQHPRVTQHGRGGLDVALLAGDFGLVRRSVMLQFFSGLEVIVAGSDLRLWTDAMASAEG